MDGDGTGAPVPRFGCECLTLLLASTRDMRGQRAYPGAVMRLRALPHGALAIAAGSLKALAERSPYPSVAR
jgi:hypothetical protein